MTSFTANGLIFWSPSMRGKLHSDDISAVHARRLKLESKSIATLQCSLAVHVVLPSGAGENPRVGRRHMCCNFSIVRTALTALLHACFLIFFKMTLSQALGGPSVTSTRKSIADTAALRIATQQRGCMHHDVTLPPHSRGRKHGG